MHTDMGVAAFRQSKGLVPLWRNAATPGWFSEATSSDVVSAQSEPAAQWIR